jgi:pimeloyl-ACP methyl ester carboxylesterase
VSALTAVNVLLGGFGGCPEGYEPQRLALEVESGEAFVFIGFTRWQRLFVSRSEYPRCLWRQALHVAWQMRKQGIFNARVFAHSMGGDVAMILADAFPELVYEIVLLNSTGLHVDGFLSTAKRFLGKLRQDLHDAKHHPDLQVREIIRACKAGGIRYLLNPLRSLAEAVTICRYRAYRRLYPSLRLFGKPVMVCPSTGDTVFLYEIVRLAVQCRRGEMISLGDLPHDVHYFPEKTASRLAAANLL